jgi:tetratricopeptide (TPR) repeat protein
MTTIQDALTAAISHHEAGCLDEAAGIYRQILAADATCAPAWYLLGTIAYRVGDVQGAIANFRQTLALNPDLAAVHNELGLAYRDSGDFVAAALSFRRAVELQPDLVQAHYNLANILYHVGKQDEAISFYESALRLKPDYAEVLNNLGVARQAKGDIAEAIECYRRALALIPNFADAYSNLGSAYQEKGEIAEAIACCKRAIELNPDYADGYRNLGSAHQELGQFTEAEACYRRALAITPKNPAVHDNLGSVLQGIGKYDEAIASHRRALALSPACASAHYNESLILLQRGEFERGWNKYEFRWKTKQRRGWDVAEKRWEGESLIGRTILLHAEQGLGDTLQFVRYAPVVKSLGATVVLVCPKSIVRLLMSVPGIDHVIGHGDDLPPFDFHSPMMSLPRVFGTTLDSIPGDVPYVFADERLIGEWRGNLNTQCRGGEFRIGIHWRGGKEKGVWSSRNIPLEHFVWLAQSKLARLVSLQKDGGVCSQSAEKDALFELVGNVDALQGAFMDTAAVMMSLDLVISCDTSIAHLAGALGVPVWVALPYVPDWRWLLDRSDSPWYPTMRLFRQKRAGDWAGVFEEIGAALRERLE